LIFKPGVMTDTMIFHPMQVRQYQFVQSSWPNASLPTSLPTTNNEPNLTPPTPPMKLRTGW